MTGFGSSCGACKFLRRKCSRECVFAPYFSYEHATAHFAAVHKVFGASNVSKLLLNLPVQNRSAAAVTISFEALARMRDPVYGCVAHIFALQQQVVSLQEEIKILGTQMANFTLGMPVGGGGHQLLTSPSNKIQFMSQLEAFNVPYTQHQHPEEINVAGYSHSFGSQMDEQLDENCLHDFYMSPDIITHHPWLEMDFNTLDMDGLSWN